MVLGELRCLRAGVVVSGILLFLTGCPRTPVDDASAFRVRGGSQETTQNNSGTGQQVAQEGSAPDGGQPDHMAARPTERPQGSSAPLPSDQPATDLLRLVDPAVHSVFGPWLREGDTLRSPGRPLTTLVFPFDPPPEFILLIVAQRVEGRESLNVTLPIGNSQVMVVLEGFGGPISGLNLVSGATADRNETTYFGRIFSPDKPVRLQFFCSPRLLAVRASGKWIIHWKGDPSVLSLDRRFWAHIPPRKIAVSIYSADTIFVIERAELTPCPEGLKLPADAASNRLMPVPPPPLEPPPGRVEESPPESSSSATQRPAEVVQPAAQASARPESEPSLPPITHFAEQPPEQVTQWKDSSV